MHGGSHAKQTSGAILDIHLNMEVCVETVQGMVVSVTNKT